MCLKIGSHLIIAQINIIMLSIGIFLEIEDCETGLSYMQGLLIFR
jgi:hypothetical protein